MRDDIIESIIKSLALDFSKKEIGNDYGVSVEYVSKIEKDNKELINVLRKKLKCRISEL